MLVPKGTFKNLIEASKIPTVKVNCNECKYQKQCLENDIIHMVKYIDDTMGYTKTGSHWLDNTCYFEVGKY
ncbi:hypothetical protein [Clostridium beijerinckii]|uniref:hypothetical protein n=1 Tax=Clostridium beijerinckii TaxID=1520 RepID=UPI0015702EB6|nr:hypothetical protein [Clostridium beijerinckii]NRU52381.1 hypothetical protein [Clostridium beijerinckii]NRU52680.1 hypothetical protein [Clostridium beijerinckii]NYC68723.1 hypothetical protein [Clostridium beijerinckii]NYC91872.1 hypothetical protein [Clostridium beijerinckii]